MALNPKPIEPEVRLLSEVDRYYYFMKRQDKTPSRIYVTPTQHERFETLFRRKEIYPQDNARLPLRKEKGHIYYRGVLILSI